MQKAWNGEEANFFSWLFVVAYSIKVTMVNVQLCDRWNVTDVTQLRYQLEQGDFHVCVKLCRF